MHLAPFADHEDEHAVIVAVKTATRVELVFDLWAICDKPLSFTKYLDGTDGGGHIYHKLPAQLADLLSSKKARIVMYDHKTMCAFYNMTGMRFIAGELYMGRFGCEPAGDEYCCIDWMLLSEHVFSTVVDKDITGTMIMAMPLLEVLKIPKMDIACYIWMDNLRR